jgi:hypothetical protein
MTDSKIAGWRSFAFRIDIKYFSCILSAKEVYMDNATRSSLEFHRMLRDALEIALPIKGTKQVESDGTYCTTFGARVKTVWLNLVLHTGEREAENYVSVHLVSGDPDESQDGVYKTAINLDDKGGGWHLEFVAKVEDQTLDKAKAALRLDGVKRRELDELEAADSVQAMIDFVTSLEPLSSSC